MASQRLSQAEKDPIMPNRPKPTISIEMKLSRDWPKVELVRSSVAGFIKATLAPTDVADRLAIASAELLENALKFDDTISGEASDPICFELGSNIEETTVAVSNSIDPFGEDAARLAETVQLIRSTEDLPGLYRDRLQAVFNGRGEGVGLIRLGCLPCRLIQEMVGERIRITAVFRRADLNQEEHEQAA